MSMNDFKPNKPLFQQDVTIRLAELTPRVYEKETNAATADHDCNTLSDALVAINSLRSQVELLGEKPIL